MITPIAGILFLSVTSLFVIIPVYFEHYFNFPHFWGYPLNNLLAVPFFIPGLILVIWTNFIFIRIKGSPVPLNPPPRLVTNGPFAFSFSLSFKCVFLSMVRCGIRYSADFLAAIKSSSIPSRSSVVWSCRRPLYCRSQNPDAASQPTLRRTKGWDSPTA